MSKTHFILYAEGGWSEISNDDNKIICNGKIHWEIELVEVLQEKSKEEIFLAVPLSQIEELEMPMSIKFPRTMEKR